MRRFPRLLLAAFPFLMAGLLDGLAFTPPCGAVTEGDRTPPIGDFAAARGRPSKKALPVIPVVKTWEELLKQPSLDLGGGVKVRLGIEATRCPRWSGVLLYACTEGYDDMQERVVNRDRLGPLWVSVHCDGRSLDAKRRFPFNLRAGGAADKQPRLFVRPVLIDRPGAYRVTARDKQGKAVASVTVTGVDDPAEPFHAWSPLLLVEDAEHERVGTEYQFRRVSPAKATYLGTGIGLPNLDGSIGFHRGGWGDTIVLEDRPRRAEPEAPFGCGPLPKLIPEQADPGLQLAIDSRKRLLLRVTPKGPITTFRPDQHFLTRWWVNGKPFFPTQEDPIRELAGGTSMHHDADVLIWLKLFPHRLGAKSGDRVGLQLLYCPSGWVPVRNPQTVEKGGATGFPQLTNRVTFTVP
jgi:hypothetical protein